MLGLIQIKHKNPTLLVGPIVNTHGKEPIPWDLGKIATTLIGDEDKANKNGSYAIVQDWIFNGLDRFFDLSIDQQSQVIGRDKISGGLYGIKPGVAALGGYLNHQLPNSHIVRTHVRTGPGAKESVIPMQIYR